jgi:hemolysin activation/secretion protein
MLISLVSVLGGASPGFAVATHDATQPQVSEGPSAPRENAAVAPEPKQKLYIREYRVSGVKLLSQQEIGGTVYPFLGPGRTVDDVEAARAALENAYKEKGFQTVTVEVPEQTGRGGIVVLRVVENKVGRLRVKGSRYFSLTEIKKHAPSLAEGTVPNFNDITRDIVALNQWPDREITPTLRAGVAPGTVDIDLTVKDKFPLHGSMELNNRYSADTTELRLNGSISYNNLWQLGHSAGFSFQIAPQRIEDAKIFSGYYLARFASAPWLTLMVLGTSRRVMFPRSVVSAWLHRANQSGSARGLRCRIVKGSTTR